jgi:putative membrane protein
MRTALALVAGGVAIVSLSTVESLPRWSAVVGAASCIGGGALAIRAVSAWARVERALRLRKPLPAPRSLATLAGGVVALAALTLAIAVVELASR